MPKMKTSKAVKKRIRITKRGKVLANKSFRRHMMTDRTPKKKRQLRRKMQLDRADRKRYGLMLPYDR